RPYLANVPLHTPDYEQFFSLQVIFYCTNPYFFEAFQFGPTMENEQHATNAFLNETYQTNYYTYNPFPGGVKNRHYVLLSNIERVLLFVQVHVPLDQYCPQS